MKFTHKDCGGLVVVYLNKSFDFYSFFNLNGEEIQITNLFIKNINTKPVLFCKGCKTEIDYSLETIMLYCDACHEDKPLKDFSFHNNGADLAYCNSCIEYHNVHDMGRKPKVEIKF